MGGRRTLGAFGLPALAIVNDYKFGTQPLAMYSPYFDGVANQVRCGAATGSGTSTC